MIGRIIKMREKEGGGIKDWLTYHSRARVMIV